MTIRFIRLLLLIAMVLVGFGASFGGGATIIAATGGRAGQITLPLKIDGATPQPVFGQVDGKPIGALLPDHGTLNLHAVGAGYAVVEILDIAITCGLWLLVLATTRRFVGQVGAGSPFEPQSVDRLRRIGWSLVALNIWSWLRIIVLPPLLLSRINPVAGSYRIMPSISEGVPGLLNARVDASLGIGLLAAGIIILVIAQAFRIGGDLRVENEAIV